MPQLPSLKQYLAKMGVTETTSQEELEKLKKQHRKLYQRLYGQQRRKEKKRLEPSLSKADYRQLKKAAARHKRSSLSRFLVDCAFAYLSKEYIPHDPELIYKYKRQINAIGNNVNQIVHQLHRTRQYTAKGAYEFLKQQLDQLEQVIMEHLAQSLPIREELVRLFTENPETVQYFEAFLEEWKAKNLGQ